MLDEAWQQTEEISEIIRLDRLRYDGSRGGE